MNKEGKRKYYNDYMKLYYHTARGRYHRLKENARKKKRPFDIEVDTFIEWYNKQDFTCSYCGEKLTYGVRGRHNLTDFTCDRKDNTRGYSIDNIAFCCRRCNLMKGDWLTEAQTLEIAGKYFRC